MHSTGESSFIGVSLVQIALSVAFLPLLGTNTGSVEDMEFEITQT